MCVCACVRVSECVGGVCKAGGQAEVCATEACLSEFSDHLRAGLCLWGHELKRATGSLQVSRKGLGGYVGKNVARMYRLLQEDLHLKVNMHVVIFH